MAISRPVRPLEPAASGRERLAIPLLRQPTAPLVSIAPAAPPAARRTPDPGAIRLALDATAALFAAVFAFGALGSASVVDRACGIAYPFIVLGCVRPRTEPVPDGSLLDELRQLVVVSALAALALVGAATLSASPPPSGAVTSTWLATLLLAALARLLSHRLMQTMPASALRRTLIVGAGAVGAELAQQLARERRHGLWPIAFLDYEGTPTPLAPGRGAAELGVIGAPDDLAAAAARSRAECVAFAFTSASDGRLLPLIDECERLGLGVFFVPRLYEAVGSRMRLHRVASLPLVELRFVDPRGASFALKYLLERLIAALLLAALAPLMVAIAVLVKATSPGPVLYRQRRVGRDGTPFTILKFRTMTAASERSSAFVPPLGAAPGGIEQADRRTPVGIWLRRSALDELPQLINVLRGEMSLIGPRPERPEYAAEFSREVPRYAQRHRVKSGITGLAQVSGLRGQTSIAERALYDHLYIRNWSFWLDLKIALRTIAAVLNLGGE